MVPVLQQLAQFVYDICNGVLFPGRTCGMIKKEVCL